MKITLLVLIWISGFVGHSISAQNSLKDSVFAVIIGADQGARMNSIQADVGPAVLALNRWANDALWNEPELVKDVAEELIDYAILEQNDSLLSWAYHYLGISYYNMHYWNLSIDIYAKALATSWAMNSSNAASFKAFSTLNIGCNYELLGEYDKAADFYYRSIRMNEDLGVPYVAAEAKLDVASLNIRLGQYSEARENILEAIDVLREFDDSVRVSEAYRMLSIIEIAEDNYVKANEYLDEALTIGNQLNDRERLAKIYMDYGDGLLQQGDVARAKDAYSKALDYCAPDKFPASYYLACSKMGQVQIKTGQFLKSETNLLRAHRGLLELKSNALLLEVEKNLADLYAKTGNYNLFQEYFELAVARKDTLAAVEKLRSIGETEVIYRTAQKDRQIEIQDLQIKNRNAQVLFASVIALIFIFGFIVVLRLLKNVRIKNIELLERNLELSRQWDQIQDSYFSNDTLDGNPSLFKEIYGLVAEKNEFINPKLSVDYLARELNSNSKYVSVAIKDKTGMNFNSFVNTFRIEKAKTMLRNIDSNKWSLDVIAENCGFNNHTTFYQTFKRNTGLTPSAFRRIRT